MQLNILNKLFLLWALVFLTLYSHSQMEKCYWSIPPFNYNENVVTDSYGENIIPYYNWPDTLHLCSDSSVYMWCDSCYNLGIDSNWVTDLAPFKYNLNFSKPIKSLNFMLYNGHEENFVFTSYGASTELQAIYSCNIQIVEDTIFSGFDTTTFNSGNGIFNISFNCPIYFFSISGNGGGGGSAFQICKNSLTTPYLWGRAKGDSLACKKDSVLFEAFGGVAPFTFLYNINGGATQTLQSNTPQVWLPTPTIPGVYTYNLLQVADGADSVAVIACNNAHTVVVNPSPTAQLHLSPQAGVAPLKVQVSNSSANASSYSWLLNNSPLGINCVAGSSCPVSITDTGSYIFTLVASNVYGCTDTATATFTALEGLHAIVPNVFSPNNDGVNDWFGITTSIAASAEIVIVNRWGNVVFEKAFSTKSDTFIEVWNGASTTDGTYFYKIRLSPAEENRGMLELSGFVNVIR